MFNKNLVGGGYMFPKSSVAQSNIPPRIRLTVSNYANTSSNKGAGSGKYSNVSNKKANMHCRIYENEVGQNMLHIRNDYFGVMDRGGRICMNNLVEEGNNENLINMYSNNSFNYNVQRTVKEHTLIGGLGAEKQQLAIRKGLFAAQELNKNHKSDIDLQCLIRFSPDIAKILRSRLIHHMPLGLTITPTTNEDFRLFHVHLEKDKNEIIKLIGILGELPCIIESYKTIDGDLFFKSGDISQMIYVFDENTDDFDIDRFREIDTYEFISGLTTPTHKIKNRKFKNFFVFNKKDIQNAEFEILQLLRESQRDFYKAEALTEFEMYEMSKKYKNGELKDKVICADEDFEKFLEEEEYDSDISDNLFNISYQLDNQQSQILLSSFGGISGNSRCASAVGSKKTEDVVGGLMKFKKSSKMIDCRMHNSLRSDITEQDKKDRLEYLREMDGMAKEENDLEEEDEDYEGRETEGIDFIKKKKNNEENICGEVINVNVERMCETESLKLLKRNDIEKKKESKMKKKEKKKKEKELKKKMKKKEKKKEKRKADREAGKCSEFEKNETKMNDQFETFISNQRSEKEEEGRGEEDLYEDVEELEKGMIEAQSYETEESIIEGHYDDQKH